MADGVSVDLDALTTFAQTMGKVADGHNASGHADGANLTGLSGMMKGFTGAEDPPPNMCVIRNGFLEAQDFATRHTVMAESVMAFLDDAIRGVISLAAGAETCAVRYASTDAANAALLKRLRAGDGKPGFSSMVLPLTGSGRVSSTSVADAFNPSKKLEVLPGTDDPSDTGSPIPVSKTHAANDPDFDKEVARKKSILDHGGRIDDGPVADPGAGSTIGQAPNTLTVPADSARLPAVPPAPVTPDVAR